MKKLANLRLPFYIGLSMVGGICIAGFFATDKYLLAITFILLFVGLLTTYIIYSVKGQNLTKSLIPIACFLLALLLGIGGFCLQLNSFKKADLGGGTYMVTGRVENLAKTNSGVRITVGNVRLSGKVNKSTSYKIAVYATGSFDNAPEVGDLVEFSCSLHDNGYIYENRLASDNLRRSIKYRANINLSEIKVTDSSPTIFESINIFVRDTLKSGMGESEFAVAYALLMGNDDYVDDQVILGFRQAGVAHIFAVSGLHIGFLATVLNFVFRKLKLKSWIAVILTFIILLFYSGACGFSSSSIRALVMCTTMLVITKLGLRYDGLSALGISAVLVLLICPAEAFCAGFQLSFIVVLGILVLSPYLKKAFKFMPKKLASSLSAVISAQVFSIPVSLWCFGEFSLVSVLLNLLFIPIVGIVYVTTLIAVIIASVFSIPTVALFISNILIKILIKVITFFDYGPFIVGGFSFGLFSIFLYAGILVGCCFFNFPKTVRTIACLSLILLSILGTTISGVVDYNRKQTYLLGTNSFCCAVITQKDYSAMVVSVYDDYCPQSRLNRIKVSSNIDSIDALIVTNYDGNTDIQNVVSAIYKVMPIKKVVYHGDIRLQEENALRLTFKGIETKNLPDGQQISMQGVVATFLNDGYCLTLNIKGKTTAIFSKFGDKPNYRGLNQKFDCVIAYDYAEQIFAEYSPKKCVSFLTSYRYLNAQNNGNLKNPF
ncbi:MAG: ComEC/Rec2 family competence protein [Clostridia bacterium]|nr:ComEC/Rec2 family competence protein [Clostridia bacterium]